MFGIGFWVNLLISWALADWTADFIAQNYLVEYYLAKGYGLMETNMIVADRAEWIAQIGLFVYSVLIGWLFERHDLI